MSVGAHEDRAGVGQAGGLAVAGRTEDVDEFIPAAGQAAATASGMTSKAW
jgi:hypothetical protein